jgi:hypothetical protein
MSFRAMVKDKLDLELFLYLGLLNDIVLKEAQCGSLASICALSEDKLGPALLKTYKIK